MDEDRQPGRGSLKNRTTGQVQQLPESPDDFTNDSFRRKKGDETTSSRTSRTQKPSRMTQRFDQLSVSSGTKSGIGGNEEDNERLMVLSTEARDALVSMQRFDRFIYVTESQKHLKAPIEGQLKRLQKIKNSGNKLMKNTYFDNELTITCLFNHMKNMYELNRDLGQIVKLKAEIEVLQQKIIEQNVKYNKDVKEAANQAKGKAVEDQQTLRDTLKVIDSIISALKDNNSARGQKKLQGELKRSSESRKQLIQLIYNLLSRVGGSAVEETIEVNEGGADIYQTNLEKIIKEQGSVAKNISYLESQKTVFEKSIKQAQTDDIRGIFRQLVQTSTYIINLNTTIKDTQTNLLEAQKKAVSSTVQSESERQTLNQLKKLQALVSDFEADGESWHRQMELINLKVEEDENYSADLNRTKKLLNSKKAINSTVSKLVNPYLSLLGMLSDKTQSVSDSRSLEQMNVQLQSANTELKNQLSTLKAQLEVKNPKGQQEVNKLITMIQQILFKDNGEPASANQLLKAKKFIQVNRKKFPEDFRTTLACLETLIKTVIDHEQHLRQKDTEHLRSEQQRVKEVNSIDLVYKTLEKTLVTNDPVNDGFLNKVRRNLEQNNSKVDKLQETPFNNLIRTANGNIIRLFELLTETYGNSKSKGDSQSEFKAEVDNLTRQLKQKESQIQNYIKSQIQLQKQIQNHDIDLSTVNTQVITTKAEAEKLLVDLQEARDREVELKQENAQREKEVQELQNKCSESFQRIDSYEATIGQIREANNVSSNEGWAKEQEIADLKEMIESSKKEAELSVKEAHDMARKLQDINNQLATLRQECHRHQQEKKGLLQETENLAQLNNQSSHVVRDLKAQIDQLNSRIRILTKLNQQYQEQISIVQLGASDEKNHISTLTLEVGALNSQVSNLRFIIQKSITEKLKVHNEFVSQTADLDQVRSQYESLKRQLSQLKSSYQAQQMNWVRDQAVKGQVEVDMKNKQTEWDQERSRHQAENGSLRDNFDNLEGSFLQQKRLIEDLQRSQSNHQMLTNQAAHTQALERKAYDLECSLGKVTQENNDLHLRLNNYSSQVSSLQNQTRMLEAQLKDQNNQIQNLKTQHSTVITTGVPQYESQRYVALKEENVVLKEQIILRDQTIVDMEQGFEESIVIRSSRVSSQKTQQAIRILQAQLLHLRQKTKVTDLEKLVQQNKELTDAIKIRQINLQNALGDNEYLFRELNKYKDNEGGFQNQIKSLMAQLTPVRMESSNDSGKDTAALRQQITGLTSLKIRLESDLRILEKTSRQTSNENLSLKHKNKLLEDGESSQRRLVQQLRQELASRKHVELKKSQDSNRLLTVKLQDMEKAFRSLGEGKQSEQTVRLREENVQLRQKLNHQQIQGVRRGEDISETQSRRDRSTLSDMIKQKSQFISTIKSMQTLLHSKDLKLLQLYDQREEDLRHLIQQNKKLQDEVNRINESLVKEKIKFLISPKSIEDSLMRMERELVEVKRQNFVLKEEIQTLELELEKGKSVGHDEAKSMSGYGLDKNLYDRVRMLEAERSKLIGRISLLSVYNRIENQSQALVSNVNRLIDNVVVFLSDSDDFGDCDLANSQFLPGVEQYLNKQDYEHYFQHVEDFFKDMFLRVVGRKNQILDRQGEQLMLLREKMQELLNEQGGDVEEQTLRCYHQRSSRSYRVEQTETKRRASQIALQHLFRLYLKAKDPAVLRQISELLSFSQGRLRLFG